MAKLTSPERLAELASGPRVAARVANPYDLKLSPTAARIAAALKSAAGDIVELAKAAFTVENNVRNIVRRMRRSGLPVRIVGWRQSPSGPYRAIYRWEQGADVGRPSPITDSEKAKRQRARMRAQYGEAYKLVHAAQKNSVPGLQIVVGGQVIYECK